MSHGNGRERFSLSPHPLHPGIPLAQWERMTFGMTKEEAEKLFQDIQREYSEIGKEQWETGQKAKKIRAAFKLKPFWLKIPCYLWFHDIDETQHNKHLGKPNSFMREVYCRRCGATFYQGPLGGWRRMK